MAKTKNPIRVLAGKKSWETKLRKMELDPAYARKIQLGWQRGLYRAKIKRKDPEGYEAFKRNFLESQEFAENQIIDETEPVEEEIENESYLLIEYLTGVMSFDPRFQSFLQSVYDDMLAEYDDNEQLLRDIAQRIDENPALVGDSIYIVESDSDDNTELRDAMYAIIETVAGSVDRWYADRIEEIANEMIPPYYHRRKHK